MDQCPLFTMACSMDVTQYMWCVIQPILHSGNIGVSKVVADALAPNRCQDICKHHDDVHHLTPLNLNTKPDFFSPIICLKINVTSWSFLIMYCLNSCVMKVIKYRWWLLSVSRKVSGFGYSCIKRLHMLYMLYVGGDNEAISLDIYISPVCEWVHLVLLLHPTKCTHCFVLPYHSYFKMYVIFVPIPFRVASLALGQSYDCPSASEVTLKGMGKLTSSKPLQNTIKHGQLP